MAGTKGPLHDLRCLMPHVRDQEMRPTCVAFAVSAAHELSRAGGGTVLEDLSEEALYWGCKQLDGKPTPGTRFSSAGTALMKWGQPVEAAWPYDPKRDDSKPYPADSPAPGADWFHGALRAIPVTVQSICAELASNRAVAVSLRLTAGFHHTTDGHIVVPGPGEQFLGRHAVLIVGSSGDGLQQATEFVFRNSWGESWGDRGYGYLPVGYLDLGHILQAWVFA